MHPIFVDYRSTSSERIRYDGSISIQSFPERIRPSNMLNANPTAAHHLIASLILTIYRVITKYSQNGSSKVISTLKLAGAPQGKRKKTQFGQRRRSSIYQLFLLLPPHGVFLRFCGRTRQGIVETADSRLCTGEVGEPMPVEKMDRCRCVGVGKDPGR